MKIIILILFTFSICNVFVQSNGIPSRHKRGVGALDIVTNHAQPIHADVKSDTSLVDKPCPKTYLGSKPSLIESGTVFQVTPPKDVYDGKSLRKSLPLTTKLDLVRAISRVVTLVVLLFSAVVEFYPVVKSLYTIVYEFINYNKY